MTTLVEKMEALLAQAQAQAKVAHREAQVIKLAVADLRGNGKPKRRRKHRPHRGFIVREEPLGSGQYEAAKVKGGPHTRDEAIKLAAMQNKDGDES
jgi:hypothetical protein